MADTPQTLAALRDSRIHLERGWLDLDRGVFMTEDERIQLTAIELKLIRVLLSNEGEPMSRDLLHVEVWGYSPKVQTRAADQAVKRLRKKLERDPGSPEHLQTAHGIGYRFVGGRSMDPAPLILLPPRAACPTNITRRSQSFVGREDLFKRLDDWFESDAGLATLVGPGGIGKTTAARVWGAGRATAAGAPAGGIWCVELGAVEISGLMTAAIARDLGMKLEGTVRPDTVGGALKARGPTLLILDNVDALAPRVIGILKDWLKQAPQLKILASSRIRLGDSTEHCIEVGPLGQADGVALMLTRIQAVSDRKLQREDVERLVTALEGIPLAMELAAARCSLFSPAEIITRLHQRLDLLVRTGEPSTDRNTTMRASIDVSWSALSPVEQDLFGQCAAFRGGFDLEAAEGVLRPLSEAVGVLEILQQLRDKSLIGIVPGTGTARTRVAILESVRAFAAEQPMAHDVAALHARHADFFAARCEQCFNADGLYSGLENESLMPDTENYRAAASRADGLEPELGVRVLLSLSKVLFGYGSSDEIVDTARAALLRAREASSMSPALLSDAWCRMGKVIPRGTAADEGASALRQGIALAEEHGRYVSSVIARADLFMVLYRTGQREETLRLAAETLTLAEAHTPELIPLVEYHTACLLGFEGDPIKAAALAWKAHAGWERLGNRKGQGTAQYALGHIALQSGDHAAAELAFSTALDILDEVGDDKTCGLHVLLGVVAMEKGDHDRAAEIVEASIELCERTGRLEWLAEDLILLGQVDVLRDAPAVARGHLERALTLFNSGVDRRKQSEAELTLALAHLQSGHVAEARARLNAWCAQPENLHRMPHGEECRQLMDVLIDCAQGVTGAETRARELVATHVAEVPLSTPVARLILRVLERELGEGRS